MMSKPPPRAAVTSLRPAAVRGKPAGPGRPKDPAKREAILEVARRLFIAHGYEGVSMDEIAAEAGVSKLTVYSHYGDKESLFAAAVKSYCETQLPDALFADVPGMPLRERLLQIGRAFYAMVSAPEAVAGHRMLCSPRMADTPLPRLFWEAGPRRVQAAFTALLERRVAAGELDIADIPRAAAQFFALLKGEPHAQLVFGCCPALDAEAAEAHVTASVELFLRAYARRG